MSTRRTFLKLSAVATLAPSVVSARGAGRVGVVGGGCGGATCARWLKRLDPALTVTLVEPNKVFTACPFANDVIAGQRDLLQQQFGYDGAVRAGVVMAEASATAIDPAARTVTIADRTKLPYDRLAMAPGIHLDWT